jgi:hypothetical protein
MARRRKGYIMGRIVLFRVLVAACFCLGAIALGSALHVPALAQTYQAVVAPFVTATSCTSTSACLQYTNNSTGPAIKGISSSGHGVSGQTDFKSTSATNFKAGVSGQDSSTSGTFDAGVLGKSTNGFGVEGTSTAGSGVFGSSTNGNGVVADSNFNSALFAESQTADGAQVIGIANDGTNSSTQNNSTNEERGRSGVWGHDDSTDGGHLNVGVEGSSTYGTGVQANSSGWVGANVVGGDYNPEIGDFIDLPALSVVAGPGAPNVLIVACSSTSDSPCGGASASEDFQLDTSGDIAITGVIKTAGSCSTGCVARDARAVSHRVESYAPMQAVPSVDDFGEAQLVDGRAYVALSPDYANVVDAHAGYLVFITPEGDSKGLYVTQMTHAGFTVRENQAGHSTLSFFYRIVAKPFGLDRPRLPMEARRPARSR